MADAIDDALTERLKLVAGRHGSAVAVAAVGVGIRWLLDPVLNTELPFSVAIISGVVLSRFAGFWPAVSAIIVGLAASRYLFIPPRGSFAFHGVQDMVSTLVPTTGGIFIAWLMDQLRRSRAYAETQSRRLLSQQLDYERQMMERQQIESSLLEAKAELRLGREEFRTLANKAPVGIFRADANGCCTFVNEHWCRIAGLTLEEALGFGWNRVIHPADIDELMVNWREAVEDRRAYAVEYRMLIRGREVRSAITIAEPVYDQNGAFAHFVGVVVDVTELRTAYHTLSEKQTILRRLIDVQEQEKSLLCHEFHDGLIQYAVASLMLLESSRCRGEEVLLPEIAADLDQVVRFLKTGIEDGRRVIRGIRTAVLDDLGLEAAVDDLVDQFQGCGIMCEQSIDLGPRPLPDSLQTTAYRIVQESLSNVRKHSHARTVRLLLACRGDELVLSISDDGCGFVPETGRGQGFGLIGMAERAALAGGECRIESTPGAGTSVTARLPVVDGETRGMMARGPGLYA